MKVFLFVFLAISAAAANPLMSQFKPTVPTTNTCGRDQNIGLGPVIQDFLKLVPLQDVLDELFTTLMEDPDVLEFFNYMATDEFEAVINLLRYHPEFINMLEFICEELHLDVYFYLNALGEILGVKPVTRPPKTPQSYKRTGGVSGLFQRIINLMPAEEMSQFWYDVASSNEYFCEFYQQMSTPEFIKMTDSIKYDPAFKAFLDDLERFNINTVKLVDWVEGFLWNRDYCK